MRAFLPARTPLHRERAMPPRVCVVSDMVAKSKQSDARHHPVSEISCMLARSGCAVRTVAPHELDARDEVVVVDAVCASVMPYLARMTHRPPILILARTIDVELAELCACQWMRCIVMRTPVESPDLEQALSALVA